MSIFSLQTNIPSLTAQSAVTQAQNKAAALIGQLASGSMGSSVDGATLAISSQLDAEVQSMAQANTNAVDAASVLQTADGGLQQIGSLVGQMQSLAVQAANGGTLDADDRKDINTEYQQLSQQVDQIANSTGYNGTSLLNGNALSPFQIGPDKGPANQLAITLPNATSKALGISDSSVDSVGSALQALDSTSSALEQVATSRAQIGSSQAVLSDAVDNLQSQQTNLAAANSQMIDTDYASALSEQTQNQILQSSAMAVDAQAKPTS